MDMKEYHWVIISSGYTLAKNQKQAEYEVNKFKRDLINDDPFLTVQEVEEV